MNNFFQLKDYYFFNRQVSHHHKKLSRRHVSPSRLGLCASRIFRCRGHDRVVLSANRVSRNRPAFAGRMWKLGCGFGRLGDGDDHLSRNGGTKFGQVFGIDAKYESWG